MSATEATETTTRGVGRTPPLAYRPRHEAPGGPIASEVDPDPGRDDHRRRWVGMTGVATLLVILTPLALRGLLGVTASSVLSDSMRPAFAAGDLVITRPIPAADLEVGQVAVLADPSRGIVRAHRIVELSPGPSMVTIVTRGDANPTADPSVSITSDAEVPIVLASAPLLGHLAVVVQRPMMAYIGLGLLLSADVFTVVITLFHRAGTVRPATGRTNRSEKGS